jgi:hypothetical protein
MKAIFTQTRRNSRRDDKKPSELTNRLFHLLLECQLVENSFSKSLIYSLSTVYLLIQAFSICSVNRIKRLLDDMLFDPYDTMLLVTCLAEAQLEVQHGFGELRLHLRDSAVPDDVFFEKNLEPLLQ